MKLAHFLQGGETKVGVVENDHVTALGDYLGDTAGSRTLSEIGSIDAILGGGLLNELIETGASAGAAPVRTPVDSLKLRSPILNPEKILCAAVNYASHGKEHNEEPPEVPYFFAKFRNTIIGPGDPIIIPRISKKADWEVELAVVIGKRGKYITKDDAFEHIAGYTISNDVSYRDILFHEGLKRKPLGLGLNWFQGKGLDGALPLGPWLVTRDELKDPQDLEISLSVNGVVRQRANTKEMVFGVDSLVEYLSQGLTLSPGDIISTGTPSGVAAFSGVPFLKGGDVVEAKLEGVGTLRNPVVQEV